jgi:hypothetical protein
MVILSAVLVWALPGRGRRDLLLWLLLGAWGAVLATILAAGLLWRRQLASAAAAAMVSLAVPFFVAPGAGVVVLAVSAAVARSRRDLRLAPSSFASPS